MTAIYIGVLIIAVGIFWIAYREDADDGAAASMRGQGSS